MSMNGQPRIVACAAILMQPAPAPLTVIGPYGLRRIERVGVGTCNITLARPAPALDLKLTGFGFGTLVGVPGFADLTFADNINGTIQRFDLTGAPADGGVSFVIFETIPGADGTPETVNSGP